MMGLPCKQIWGSLVLRKRVFAVNSRCLLFPFPAPTCPTVSPSINELTSSTTPSTGKNSSDSTKWSVNYSGGGIRSVPPSKRTVLSTSGADTAQKLWAIRLSPDLRVIVEDSGDVLTVREIARKGRIQFYRDLAAQ